MSDYNDDYNDYVEDFQNEPVDIGLATPFTASKKAVQFITDEYGVLWVPVKGIHEDSDVWEPGQPKGRLVLKLWCAELKELA